MHLDSRTQDEGRGKLAKLRDGGETDPPLSASAMETLRAKYGDKLGKLMAIAPTLTLALVVLMGAATATQAASRQRLNVFDQQEAQTEQPLTQSHNSVSGLYTHSMASGTALTGWVDGENNSVDDRSEQILENSQANWCPWWWPSCNGGGSGGGSGNDDDD